MKIFVRSEQMYFCCGLVKIGRETESTTHTETAIPLLSVNVNSTVVHAAAQVEITQVYANEEDEPIQAFYAFPVNQYAAVTHFQAELEGRVIKVYEERNINEKTDEI